MSEDKRTGLCLTATLTIIGLLMVFVPVNIAIIMLMYGLFRNNEYKVSSSVEGPSTVYLQSHLPGSLVLIGLGVFAADNPVKQYQAMRGN